MDNILESKDINIEAKIIIASAYEIAGLPNDSLSISGYGGDIDWEKVYLFADNNRSISMVYKYLIHKVPGLSYKNLEDAYLWRLKRKQIMKKEIVNVFSCLEKKGMFGCYIKGLLLGKYLYNDLFMREFGDIDILFKRKDLLLARDILLNELDYKQVNKGLEYEEHLDTTGVFHEFWLRKEIDNIPITIEVKCSTSAVSAEYIDDFLQNPIKIKIDDFSIYTMNLYHSILHLFFNVYENFESKNGVFSNTTIRDLLDCYLLITKYYEEIDWNKVVIMASKYNSVHKIYCVLKYTEIIFMSDKLRILEGICLKTSMNHFLMNGSKWPWKKSVIERIFMTEEERVKDYYELVYEKVVKKTLENDYQDMVESDSKTIIINQSVYKTFSYDECNYDAKYLFTYNDSTMYINILLNQEQYGRNDILLQFLFVTQNKEKSVWLSNEGGYKYCIREDIGDTGLEFNDMCEVICYKNQYIVRIPLELHIQKTTFSEDYIIGYNLQLYKKFDNGLTIQMMTLFAHKYSLEESFDNMEVCRIKVNN